MTIRLGRLGTYASSVFGRSAALASAYDPASQRLFVVNADADAVDVLSLSNPADPFLLFSLELAALGSAPAAVAVGPTGIIAVAVTGTTPQTTGTVAFFDAAGNALGTVPVGPTSRALAFTPDGQRLLVANAGEPNAAYTVDPRGSVSIVDLSNGPAAATVQARGFAPFDAQRAELRAEGVRIFGPNASVSQDLEPEAIAIAEDGLTATIVLQENNAVAVLDLTTNAITEIRPLGIQDYRRAGNALDPSNDGEINIEAAPVRGLYQPGAIATFTANGETFFVFANQGASRDSQGFSEVSQVRDLTLDPVAFPAAPQPPAPQPPATPSVSPAPLPQFTSGQVNAILGDLAVSTFGADVGRDGDVDRLFAFGTRSFSIRDAAGNLVYDSGPDFERITAEQRPELFNASSLANVPDRQSNGLGPEPSDIAVGQVGDRTYAFTTLQGIGGVMVYDVTDPANATFVQYINNRNAEGRPATGEAGDLGPTDITFIAAADSPTGGALVTVANAVSGTTSVYGIFNPIEPTTEILINEIRTDQPGANTDHYFELLGSPGTSLDDLTYLVIGDGLVDTDGDGIADANGGSGVVEAVVDLSGQGLGQDGLFVAAESTFSLGQPDLVTQLNFENNDNVTHLLVQGFTGSVDTDLDTDDDGVLDVIPWTTLFDSVAILQSTTRGELVYSETTVGPDVFLAPGYVFRTPIPDPGEDPGEPVGEVPVPGEPDVPEAPGGEPPVEESPDEVPDEAPDDGPAPGEFQIGPTSVVAGADTPGRPNDQVLALTPIYEIQGAGHTSPLVNQLVLTTGIVTALGRNGFYLQSAFGDNDVATSDALFVFTDRLPNVLIGDRINVQGTVAEPIPGGQASGNLPITRLTDPIIFRLSGGNSLPAAVVLGPGGRSLPTEVIDDDQPTAYNLLTGDAVYEPETDGIDFYESLEGMRVTVPTPVVVGPTNRFGEIYTYAGGSTPTGLSDRGTLNISPGDFNPERIQIDPDPTISPTGAPAADVGDTLSDVTGVVSYRFGNYEVIPTEAFTVTDGTLAAETSPLTPTANQLTIASYNVFNLDPVVEGQTLVSGQDADNVDDDLGSGRFAAIANDIVTNLNAPDIIGLQEVQDNDGAQITGVRNANRTLRALSDAIAAAGGPIYRFVDTPGIVPASRQGGTVTRPTGGQPGGNIRVGFLYNPRRVSLVEDSVVPLTNPTDQATNPDNPFFGSRIPLSATFEFNQQPVTVVNSHFSSKGGSQPLFGQAQPATDLQSDEAAGVNGGLDERIAQAEAVQAYVGGLLADNPDANVVALGDFNEFEFLPPLEILEQDLTNLTNTLPEDERYSFIFEGNSQSLDHILVSDSLSGAAEFDVVHLNSEFATTPQRASDHDPLLARLTIAPPALPEVAPAVPDPLAELPGTPLGTGPAVTSPAATDLPPTLPPPDAISPPAEALLF